jgi:hypothetical protein
MPFVAACGGEYSGFLRDAANVNEHQYRMNIASVHYSRTVSGSSSVGKVLCAIPLDATGVYKQAMGELQSEAHLEVNQVLENIREDHQIAWYMVYCVHTLTISADVYDVTPLHAEQAKQPPSAATQQAPTVDTPQLPTPTVEPPKKLTYAQLHEALSHVQADKDDTSHHDIAVRILGRPHRTDAEAEYWYGSSPGRSDCYVLRLSATKGDTLSSAPADLCR